MVAAIASSACLVPMIVVSALSPAALSQAAGRSDRPAAGGRDGGGREAARAAPEQITIGDEKDIGGFGVEALESECDGGDDEDEEDEDEEGDGPEDDQAGAKQPK